jgi:predicted permease
MGRMNTGRAWLLRLGGVFKTERRDRELAAELESHVQMHIEDNVRAGMTPEEARRQAVLKLGGIEQLKESCRDQSGFSWLESLTQDARFAVRMLSKNPGFTAVAVVTLALGIGANTAMFTIVNAWLLRPLPLKNPQELVSVWRTRLRAPRQPAYFDLYHDYLVWSTRNRTFQSLAAVFQWDYTLTGAGEPQEVHGAVASWNFFQMIGASPERGRLFEAEDVRNAGSCVISHALWKEQFHSVADIVGQTIELNRKPCRVIGVLPAGFSLRVLDRAFETAVWRVIKAGDERYNSNSPSPVAVIGRLRKGVTAAQAEADLSALQAQLDRQSPDGLVIKDSGILVANLQEDNTRTIRSSLWLLLGAAGVLLIIACVNTGSLILGRNARRSREFAVRMALGCGAGRLLRQLTVEILTIFILGGVIGLPVALGLLRMFVLWSPFGVLPPDGISLDARVLAGTTSIVCLTALFFGSLPALRALNIQAHNELRSGAWSTPARAHLRWRSLFVAMEIALSVVLLVGAGLLISTFVKIDSEPLGFQTHNVFVTDVALPRAVYRTADDRTRFCEELLQKARHIPGVQAAGSATSWPFNVDGLTPLETDQQQGLPIEQLPQAATFEVSPGYFGALGIPLLRGRALSDGDLAGSMPVALINDEMASKYFRGVDPVGKHVRLRYVDQPSPTEPWLTIVGVVGDTSSVRYNHIEWDKYPAVYTSFFQYSAEFPADLADTQKVYVYLRAKSSINAAVIASAVHGIDSNLPLGTLQTAGQVVSDLRSQPRVRATLMGSFGLWTLLLAAVGVGGVMGQAVEQRRHDIGVRMALGAQRHDVMRLILGQGARLAIFGSLVGLAAAWGTARLMTAFLYGVAAADPATFITVPLILIVVALAAAWIPARRAMDVDPMVVLRYE